MSVLSHAEKDMVEFGKALRSRGYGAHLIGVSFAFLVRWIIQDRMHMQVAGIQQTEQVVMGQPIIAVRVVVRYTALIDPPDVDSVPVGTRGRVFLLSGKTVEK